MADHARDTRRRLPIGGFIVLALVGGAILLFTSGESLNPFSSPTTSNQAMQLTGQWLGMRLAAANTPAASALGVDPASEGVVVAEVLADGVRAQQAGIAPGDVLVGIDGNSVGNLTQLYTLTTTLDVNRPLTLTVSRYGQPLALLLPPPAGSPMMAGPMAPQGFAAPPATNGPAAAFGPATLANPALNANAQQPMLFCPNDNLFWTPAQAGPGHTCPRCGGQLAR